MAGYQSMTMSTDTLLSGASPLPHFVLCLQLAATVDVDHGTRHKAIFHG